MALEILIDSEEFVAKLNADLLAARQKIYIQTFSFEGDSIGEYLSNTLINSSVGDIKIIIDSYSNWVINDKFLYSPFSFFDTELLREHAKTKETINKLRSVGVNVKFTNPFGFMFSKLAARNHKKLILIDNSVAYIGGINFCEHNFSWHDMMLRIESEEISDTLSKDFLSTYEGKNIRRTYLEKEIEIQVLDGNSNHIVFDKILRLIENAENEIFVESPYLSFPFCDSLRSASRKGINVVIVSPEANNWGLVKHYIIQEAIISGFKLHFYQEKMSHLKSILIDQKYLILGSSNFDYFSYRLHQEIVAIITKREVISDFYQRVMKIDLKNAKIFNEKRNIYINQIFNWFLRSIAKVIAWPGCLFK